MSIQEQINQIKDMLANLEKQIANEQVVPSWEPKSGNWFLTGDGKINIQEMSNSLDYSEFGHERDTKPKMELAMKRMRVFNRLLAYREEFDPDYYFKYFEANYCVSMNQEGQYTVSADSYDQVLGTVYFAYDVASDLCVKLESGEVEL